MQEKNFAEKALLTIKELQDYTGIGKIIHINWRGNPEQQFILEGIYSLIESGLMNT